MDSKRIFFIMVSLVSLMCLASIGAVFVGNSMLSKQAKQLLDLRLEDKLIEEQQAALLSATKELEQYTDLEKIAKTVVPQDKDQAKTVREINRIAEESGIKLKSITFAGSNLGAGSTKTSEDNESGEETKSTTPPLTQVQPVTGIPGVYSLELEINPLDTQTITYSQFIKFLERLERNRRTAHVVKVAVTPGNGGAIRNFVLTVNVYVKP